MASNIAGRMNRLDISGDPRSASKRQELLEHQRKLPVYEYKEEIVKSLRKNQVIVVVGETGSGKSTQLTQYLAEGGFADGKGIIGCTQPRRVAAVSVAKRVAEEYGCRLGKEVGYAIRFDDCTSSSTKIKYLTDGILLKESLNDPLFSKYSVIMLDEAHERTINTDVLFGLLKTAAKQRKNLKIVVTSATLDAEKFAKYFFNAPILNIPGRTYPVDIIHTRITDKDYVEAAIRTVMDIHKREPPGPGRDILVFLTGQEEIDSACDSLSEKRRNLGTLFPDLIVLPIYSSLPPGDQVRIFNPAPAGARKVVVATNIAETSLTIDGIFYVIDSGFVKQKDFNPKTGMDSLAICWISQAQAKQRAGRAGRTGPGKCYRLYSEQRYSEMLPTQIPEIQRANMMSVVLQFNVMGIKNLATFDFMDPPSGDTIDSAILNLKSIGALDPMGEVTALGRKIADFPLDPRLAKSLITSSELGSSAEMLTIVSMLSVQSVFHRPGGGRRAMADRAKARLSLPEGDLLTLLNTYNTWLEHDCSPDWAWRHFVNQRNMKEAREIRSQLTDIMRRHNLQIKSCDFLYINVQKAICAGFFRNAIKRDPPKFFRKLEDGQIVHLHPSSTLFKQDVEWAVYFELTKTKMEYIREVTRIEAKWLNEVAFEYFRGLDPLKTWLKRKQLAMVNEDKKKPLPGTSGGGRGGDKNKASGSKGRGGGGGGGGGGGAKRGSRAAGGRHKPSEGAKGPTGSVKSWAASRYP